MEERVRFYIDGQWVDPAEPRALEVINPATEAAIARISLGGPADVDRAVKAARVAFKTFSRTSKKERLELVGRILVVYQAKLQQMAETISREMGAPMKNEMTIAREEIFGPVLAILPYNTEEQAIELANDTDYGLSGYVQSGDKEHALKVAAQLRAGNVHINGAGSDFNAPFGGYKKSGNGREWGIEGFEEFLEIKAIMGAA
jgi:acyl-CoA reductase-like NAD-dependent aldehyde dehydrogenase